MGMPLDLYSTTVSLGDTDLTATMDASFFSNRHDWTPVSHEHSFHELFFVTRGSCEIHIHGMNYHFLEDDLIWIPKAVSHCVCTVSEHSYLYSMGVMLTERRSKTGLQDIYQEFSKLFGRAGYFMRLSGAHEGMEIVQKIRSELSKKQFGFIEQINSYLSLLYIFILRRCQGIPERSDAYDLDVDPGTLGPENRRQYDEMITNIWFFRRYMEKFTISDVARSLNMSTSQTNRFIQRLYGMGFSQKLLQVRMNVAKNLLTGTSLPAEQIAEAVGYSSYKGFFAAFKKHTGTNPIHFRIINKMESVP